MLQKIRQFLRFWKYNTNPQHIELKTRRLVQFGNARAFKLFKDDKFRKIINFSNLERIEQDRIFNELIVSNIVMLMIVLDQLIIEASGQDDKKEFFKALRQSVPDYQPNFLKSLGIEDEHIKIWRKLIDLRYDEYQDRVRILREFYLKSDDDELAEFIADNKIIAVLETFSIGTCDHILRGRLEKDHPLLKFIKPYFVFVIKGFMKRV